MTFNWCIVSLMYCFTYVLFHLCIVSLMYCFTYITAFGNHSQSIGPNAENTFDVNSVP